jgi:rsbT antagonist protein RsbS
VFVSILRRGDFLIASIHAALDDEELMQFQADLIDQVGKYRARTIVIDMAALDVLDSFASKSLHDLAYMAPLRDPETEIVGIQPKVGFALVRLARGLDVHAALDLEEGLALLERLTPEGVPATARSARWTTERGRARACPPLWFGSCRSTSGSTPPFSMAAVPRSTPGAPSDGDSSAWRAVHRMAG